MTERRSSPRGIARSPWPQRTTMWAGLCCIVAAALMLLDSAHLELPLLEDVTAPLSGWALGAVGAVVLLLGFAVLAFGAAGELGVAGTSRIGRLGLLGWGAEPIVLALVVLLPWDAQSAPGLLLLPLLLQLLSGASALVGAIVVGRARVLGGVVRWALLPIAVLHTVVVLAQSIPSAALIGLAEPAYLLQLGLLLATGIAYLLHGRIEAVKHRARMIEQQW